MLEYKKVRGETDDELFVTELRYHSEEIPPNLLVTNATNIKIVIITAAV